MFSRRYGKFQFWDCCAAWIGSLILFFFGAILVFLDVSSVGFSIPPVLGPFLITFSCVWIASVLIRYNEHFTINQNIISIRKFGKTSKITIPPKAILIISYADIHEKMGIQSYQLTGKYSIAILDALPLNDALKILHANYVRRYTNSSIEIAFAHRFIYSFVFNLPQTDQLLQNDYDFIIIPESLANKVIIPKAKSKIYIDMGY